MSSIHPDLSHIDTWIFDLDNTLYPASANLFLQIDVKMKAFISRLLDIDLDDAYVIQKKYYREHGTTLCGLMLNYDVDPEEFLDFVHDIDHTVLEPNPGLAHTIQSLPGRKLIHTNGSDQHAEDVLSALGIEDCFEAIFDIRAGAYVPKPDPESYRRFLHSHAFEPTTSIMFEDSVKNLKPAAEMGMVTVLVQHESNAASTDADEFCHHVTEDLPNWLKQTSAKLQTG